MDIYGRFYDWLVFYKILSCIFPKKSFWKNQELRSVSSRYRSTYSLMPARFAEVDKNKKEVILDLLFCLAPLLDGSCNIICEYLI
jgi:hypothetical protein